MYGSMQCPTSSGEGLEGTKLLHTHWVWSSLNTTCTWTQKFFWYDTGTFCRLPIMSSIKENLSGFIMIQQSHTHTSSSSTYTIYIYMYIASSILCKTTKSDPLWVWGWNYGSEAETMGLRLKLWAWGWDYGSGTETFALQVMKSWGGGRGAGKEASDYGHTFTLWHTHTHTHMWLLASFPGPARSLLAVRNDDHG